MKFQIESRTGCTHNFKLYSGKGGNLQAIITEVQTAYQNKWHKTYADYFYNCGDLAKYLYNVKSRICGIVWLNSGLQMKVNFKSHNSVIVRGDGGGSGAVISLVQADGIQVLSIDNGSTSDKLKIPILVQKSILLQIKSENRLTSILQPSLM
uniref:Uncharacterized protein n=1 Tax=Glossina pallidipes TaxID=7398 RepID=A0A1B0ADZ1_GLOPL